MFRTARLKKYNNNKPKYFEPSVLFLSFKSIGNTRN